MGVTQLSSCCNAAWKTFLINMHLFMSRNGNLEHCKCSCPLLSACVRAALFFLPIYFAICVTLAVHIACRCVCVCVCIYVFICTGWGRLVVWAVLPLVCRCQFSSKWLEQSKNCASLSLSFYCLCNGTELNNFCLLKLICEGRLVEKHFTLAKKNKKYRKQKKKKNLNAIFPQQPAHMLLLFIF